MTMLGTIACLTQPQPRRLRLCRRRSCRALRGRPRSTCAAAPSSSAPMLDAILARHDYPGAGRPAARRSVRADGAARHLAEVRGQVHPADPHRRAGRHAGCRFLHAGCAARLCAFRRRPRWTPPLAAGETAAGACSATAFWRFTIDQGEHMQRYQGIVRARRRHAGRGRRHLFPPVGADPDRRPAVASPSCRRAGRQAARALACRRPAGAVPAGGARAHARARPAMAATATERRGRRPRTTMPGRKCRRWWPRSTRDELLDPDGRRRAAAVPAVPRARRAGLRAAARSLDRCSLLARAASRASSRAFPPRRSRTAPRTARSASPANSARRPTRSSRRNSGQPKLIVTPAKARLSRRILSSPSACRPGRSSEKAGMSTSNVSPSSVSHRSSGRT